MSMPDPAAVADFLGTAVEKPAPGAVELNLDPAAREAFLTPPDKQEEKKRIDTPLDPLYSGVVTNQGQLSLWVLNLPELGDVKVEDGEKISYLKAVLNDVPVVFAIGLAMGLDVEFQSRSTRDIETVFAAADADAKSEVVRDPSGYATRIQHYSVMTQLRKIGGKEFPRFVPDPGKSLFENAEAMRAAHPVAIDSMNSVRWSAVFTALRIFEVKLKICADAAANGDFWKPAS
jgi:hypothetical protein